jgi:hypothetical protein
MLRCVHIVVVAEQLPIYTIVVENLMKKVLFILKMRFFEKNKKWENVEEKKSTLCIKIQSTHFSISCALPHFIW